MIQWGSPHEQRNRIHWIRIPDPHSMWSRVSYKRHADYAHCTDGLNFTHCHAHSIARSSDPDRGLVEAKWSLVTDPHQIRIQIPVWRVPTSAADTECPKNSPHIFEVSYFKESKSKRKIDNIFREIKLIPLTHYVVHMSIGMCI